MDSPVETEKQKTQNPAFFFTRNPVKSQGGQKNKSRIRPAS